LKYIDDRQRCTAQNQHTLKLAHPESNGTAIRLVPNCAARAGGGASCGSGAFNSASVALGCGTGSHAAQLARNDKQAKFTPELAEKPHSISPKCRLIFISYCYYLFINLLFLRTK